MISKWLIFGELKQPERLKELRFIVDMTGHLSTLFTLFHKREKVIAFECKLNVLATYQRKSTLKKFIRLT